MKGLLKTRLLARWYTLISLSRSEITFFEFAKLLLPGRFRAGWDATHLKTTIDMFGHRFRVPLGNFAETLLAVDPSQYCLDLIKDGDVVIDAGANVGSFSILVAQKYPNTKIYAFEPSPTTFAALSENAKPYKNIHCINAGLGDAPCKREFVISSHGTTGNHFFDGVHAGELHSGERLTLIPITTIDIELAGERVNFIKADIEGYEAQLLEGAKASITRWKPIIHLSAYHLEGDIEKLPALLKSFVQEYSYRPFSNYGEDIICSTAPEEATNRAL